MQPGCIAAWRVFYILPTEGEYFSKPTLLQLDHIYEFDVVSVVRNGIEQSLKHVGDLRTETFGQLRNCVKQIREDISEKHYKLIFK